MSWKCHEKSTPLKRKPTTNYGNVVLRWYSFYFYSWSHSLQQSFFFTLWFYSLLLYTGLLQVVSLRISTDVATENAQLPVSLITQLSHTEIFGAQLNNQPLSATSITDSTLIGSPSPLLPPLPTLQQSARFNCCWIIELSLSLFLPQRPCGRGDSPVISSWSRSLNSSTIVLRVRRLHHHYILL